ncbi:DNA cytosine methyltransferase, partial [Soonwooa sp.]
MTKQQLTFLDLFSGVGGFRLGLEKAGHRCIGFCEIDAKARESYKAIHNTENEVEMHDITTISDEFVRGIGRVDIIAGGFPCQAFSVAGKRKGFRDTRGTLFFEIARFAHILQPKYLFLENVKGLLNHDSGATFETILRTLDELGYNVEWQVLNSKNYVPQNRERVFIIGRLRGASTNQIFPITGEESQINFKSAKINSKGRKQQVVGNVNPSARGMNGNVFSSDAISPTITCNNGEGSKIMVPAQSKTTHVEKRIIVEGLLDNKFRSSSAVVSVNGF